MMHAAADFAWSTLTVSAERVDASTPGARVTWSTTVPPECVASVRVECRSWRRGSVVRSYTTTNTSETEIILTGLQCGTTYYIRVVVAGVSIFGGSLQSNQVQVLFGGKVASCEVRCILIMKILEALSPARSWVLGGARGVCGVLLS